MSSERPIHEIRYDSLNYQQQQNLQQLVKIILHAIAHSIARKNQIENYFCPDPDLCENVWEKTTHQYYCKTRSTCTYQGCKSIGFVSNHLINCQSVTCTLCNEIRKDVDDDSLQLIQQNPLYRAEMYFRRNHVPNYPTMKSLTKEE